MAKLRLDDRKLIPFFHLQARGTEDFDLSSFKKYKKNLVLFFLSSPEKEFLLELEDVYEEIKNQNAEVVLICPLPLEEVEKFHMGNRLTFWMLSDKSMEVFAQFIDFSRDEDIAALFITDKFGDLYFQYLFERLVDLPSFEDIVKTLALIESQYPQP